LYSTASNCKGRHIQKLHDFLKDVFREESQVHVVHGDDEWEESEEAWELGEEEMMIVGMVQQEDEYSWQDASKSWLEQDEEVAASPERPKADQPVGSKEDPKGKAAPAKGKDKKKNRKKALKGNKVAAKGGAQKEEGSTASLISKQGKQAAPDLLSNPEA
jgi:hypothetical protein